MNTRPDDAGGEVVLCESPDGEVRLDVRLERELVWLTQRHRAELFGRDKSVISGHLQRALAADELSPESTMQRVHSASSDRPIALCGEREPLARIMRLRES